MQNEHIELFEKYILNELNDAEKVSFEAKLTADPDFLSEFQTFKTLKAGIRLNAMQEKLTMLKNIKIDPVNALASRTNYTKYLMYLLGFIALTAIVYFATNTKQAVPENQSKTSIDTIAKIIPNTPIDTLQKGFEKLLVPKVDSTQQAIKPSPKDKIIIAHSAQKSIWEEVISLYKRPESFAVILRDTPTQKDLQYKNALQWFDKQEYNKVQSALSGSEDEKSQYLLAHSYLLSKKTDQAAAIFRNMANDDFSVYHDEAKFYLALSLLENKKDHLKEITQLLDDLQNNPSYAVQIKSIKSILAK